MTLRSLPLLAVVLLAGCASEQRDYPSLLPRAIEKRSDAEPVRAAPVAAPDPALDARIKAWGDQLATNTKDFATAETAASNKAAAAKGRAAGSDPWLDAQTALAELDQLRADALALVTELEDAQIARATDGQPAYPALDATHDAAQAQADTETQAIARLAASLAPAG